MPRPTHNTTKLPKQLLAQLGIEEAVIGKKYGSRTRPQARKERRKAARVEKKSHKPTPIENPRQRRQIFNNERKDSPSSSDQEGSSPARPDKQTTQPLKSALKQATGSSRESAKFKDTAQHPRVPRGMRDRLAADDVEIQALERALGVKSNSKLPKAFEEEGLGDLLEGLDETSDEGSSRKRKRGDEGSQWLEAKRQKAKGLGSSKTAALGSESDGRGSASSDESGTDDNDLERMSPSGDEGSVESFLGFDEEEVAFEIRTPKKRENPYIPPVAPDSASKVEKYVPPSMRKSNVSDGEELSQLRRQVQGLLNRLSDANIIAILADIEKLYQNYPRQHVSTTLIHVLAGMVFDSSALQDTFIILHAGFVAAVFKVIGSDFGAQIVQQTVAQFDSFYQAAKEEGSTGKKLRNTIAFLAQLYSFQVVGSNLIYDLVRLFLENISEENTELLLKIVQSAGPQLRQDDPSSLKDILYLLQSALARLPPGDISVRTKFMVETVNNLKNNRMKTGIAASSIASEHTVRMRKILGSLNTRSLKASEPLRIGLKDIRDTDKRGKWWLIGASYRDEQGPKSPPPETVDVQIPETRTNEKDARFSNDLLDLAKAHRMNTDVRRSIFVTIMSATDYRDAHIRLLKLRLKKVQELEMPRVLLHCAAVEGTYNPYYTLIARKLCTDKRLKIAFQFALWDVFKRMAGDDGEDEAEALDGEEGVEMKEIVHLAKMYGALAADGGLSLSILKPLSIAYLSAKEHTWLELFLITVIVQSQKDREKEQRSEAALKRVFEQSIEKDRPKAALELRRFLQKYVRKTDVAGGKEERRIVRWGVGFLERMAQQDTLIVDH